MTRLTGLIPVLAGTWLQGAVVPGALSQGGLLPGAALAGAVFVARHPRPQVRIAASSSHRWQLGRAGPATRWFSERGFTRRVRSGDRAFDERWALQTDDVEFGEALLRLPAARAALEGLGALGALGVCQGRRHLTVTLGRQACRALKEPEQKAALEGLLSELGALSAGLQRASRFPQRPGRSRLFVAWMLLSAALFAAGIALTVRWAGELLPGEMARLATASLLCGLPIGAVLLAAAMAPLSGRSSSHHELALLGPTLVPAVMLATLAGALAANRSLDSGPPVARRVPVLELRERRDEKRLRGYWAVVPDWEPGPATGERASGGHRGGGRALDEHATGPHAAGERATRRIRLSVRDGRALLSQEPAQAPPHALVGPATAAQARGAGTPLRGELLLHVSPGALGAQRLLGLTLAPAAAAGVDDAAATMPR